MLQPAVRTVRNMGLHHLPDFVGDGDAVAVQVHRERRDDMRLGAKADGGGKRLAGQHMGAVEFACNHAIKQRSEEHTSELQSLMRISYAVFCLKKKNT